jgi:lysocardiolipin and lysophospholipid acyltransferase
MMAATEFRRRTVAKNVSGLDVIAGDGVPEAASTITHPSGKEKYGQFVSFMRLVSFSAYFAGCCITIHATQILGVPLYFINRDLYYAYMSLTKQSFGLLVTTMTHWWAPSKIRISGDASVAAQLSLTRDGRVQCAFPERMVMIANHQVFPTQSRND